jgi:hypothetical protein
LKIEKADPWLVHHAVEAVKMQAENKQIEIVIDEEENLYSDNWKKQLGLN